MSSEVTELRLKLEAAEEALRRIKCYSEDGALNGIDYASLLYAEKRAAEAKAEADALRKVVSECAEAVGNGSFCSPNASIEFMQSVPVEIKAETDLLRNLMRQDDELQDLQRFGVLTPELLEEAWTAHRKAWEAALKPRNKPKPAEAKP